MKIFLLALLFSVFLAPAAQAETGHAPVAIVILPFDSALEKPFQSLKEGMPDLLTACFTGYDGADILDRSALAAISREKTVNFDPGDYRQLRGATHVLRGSLAPQGGGFLLTLMLYDAASAKLAASASVAGDSASAAATACAGVKQLVAGLAAIKPPVADAAPVSAEDALQSRLMIEGLGHYYNGAYDKAFPAFMKAIKADPGNAAAVYWLGKSYENAGMDDLARVEFRQFLKNFPRDPRTPEVVKILAPPPETPGK